MKALTVLVMLASIGSDLFAQPRLDPIRQTEQIMKDMESDRRRSQQNSRIDQLENALYETRYPTPEEVAKMREKWRTDNPLIFSGNMPKFENLKIRVHREKTSPPAEVTDARFAQIEQRLQAQEMEKKRGIQSTPLTDYQGAITRRLSDGSISASINGSILRFKSAAAYNQHITNLEYSDQRRRADEEKAQLEYKHGVAAARDRAFKKYPVLADDNSLERLALESYVNRLLGDDANKAFFKDSNWPEIVVDQFTATYQIGPTGRK
jgi:hypothetical protein